MIVNVRRVAFIQTAGASRPSSRLASRVSMALAALLVLPLVASGHEASYRGVVGLAVLKQPRVGWTGRKKAIVCAESKFHLDQRAYPTTCS